MESEQSNIVKTLSQTYPFNQIDKKILKELSYQMHLQSYSAGDVVYKLNEDADEVFVIIDGIIELMGENDQPKDSISIANSSLFGLEACLQESIRIFTAKAFMDTLVIVINIETIEELAELVPQFKTAVGILVNSFNLSHKKDFTWMKSGERIIFIDRKHPFFFYRKILLPFVLAVALIIFSLYQKQQPLLPDIGFYLINSMCVSFIILRLVYSYLFWNNEYAIMTDKRILKQRVILPLHESRQEALMNMVLSVGVDTNLVSRGFNFGNVDIRTYAGTIVLPGLANPYQVSSLIQSEWFRIRRDTNDGHVLSSKENIIKSRLGLSDTNINQASNYNSPSNKSEESTMMSRGLLHFIARLLQIRIDTGREIIYRTHWFLVLKRITLPTILLLFTQLLLSAKLTGKILFTLDTNLFIIFSILIDLILIIWWVYYYLDWRNDFYLLTDEFIVDVYKKPLGREERKSAPLRNIQSIEFERHGIIGLVLNFGTVHILVGESVLTFDNVFDPSGVQRDIFDHVIKREDVKNIQHTQQLESQMGDWIEAYHKVINDNQ